MAGICLCRNEECEKKETCLRFKQESNDISSFAEFKNICHADNEYEWYWHIVEEKPEESIEAVS